MKRAQITCCYKCEDRHPGCHSTCDKYIQQKKEHAEFLEASKKESDYGAYVIRKKKNHSSFEHRKF